MDAGDTTEHRFGDAYVTIDVNEPQPTTPLEVGPFGSLRRGPVNREVIFRVRTGAVISVYRCTLADSEMPRMPYDVARYLLTQATPRALLFAYCEVRFTPT